MKVFLKITVGDPLLGSVDNKVFAIVRQLGSSTNASNIRTSEGFSDSKADTLLSRKNFGNDLIRRKVGKISLPKC